VRTCSALSLLGRQLRLLRAYALLTYPFACVPFLYLFFAAHGLSADGYGLVIAVYYLAMFGAEVPTGIATDRFGTKPMLVLGPLCLALGFAVLWLWPCLPGFVTGEALLGLGHAALSGPPATILYESLREHGEQHRFLAEESRMHGLRLLGTGSAFLLGGALAELLGDSGGPALGASIPLTCALTVAAAVVALWLRPEPGHPALPLRVFARSVAEDLAHPPVRWLLAYWIVLFALLRFPFHDYQPYLDAARAQEPLFGNQFAVGVLYALLNLLAAPLSFLVPALVARCGRRLLFWGMPLLLCASLLVMAWERATTADGGGSRALAWLGVSMFFVQQVPFGMHWALLQEFINHRIRPAGRTTVMSALSLGARLCYAVVNVLLFAVQSAHGMATALLVAGCGGALATCAVLWLRPRGLLRGEGPVA